MFALQAQHLTRCWSAGHLLVHTGSSAETNAMQNSTMFNEPSLRSQKSTKKLAYGSGLLHLGMQLWSMHLQFEVLEVGAQEENKWIMT